MRGAAIALAASALLGCVPSRADELSAPGVQAAILVRVGDDGALFEARAIEPFPDALPSAVITATGTHLMLLGYPRPLSSYGLRVDSAGHVEVVRDGGAPLPPPSTWLEIDVEAGPKVLDVPARWPGLLADVRVPWSLPCVKAEMVAGSFVALEPGNLSFVAALGRDHTLVVYPGSRTEGVDAQIQVRTATGGAPFRVPLPVGPERPHGFTEADGTPWLFIGNPEVGTAQVCRFDPSRPHAAPACSPAEGDLVPIERIAGQRRPDGTLEMAAVGFEGTLLYWRGDAADRGRWRRVFRGGVYESPACVTGAARVAVTFDGPGRGVAAFESGTLEAWDADTGEHHGIFQDEAGGSVGCHWAYARHPDGFEVAARIAGLVGPLPSLPDAEVWWRTEHSAGWSRHPTAGVRIGAIARLGSALVASSRVLALQPLVLDPRRIDLPLPLCGATDVFNTSDVIVAAGPDQIITGGVVAPGVARWQLVPE